MSSTKPTEIVKTPPPYVRFTDLAAEKLGGKVLYATDDFFAEKENLLKPTRGVFIEGKYTDRGKWMDGWESRRKRTAGHDWAVIQLATAGKIAGFDIDTHFFLGNHPPIASVEAALVNQADQIKDWETEVQWKEIVSPSTLDPGSQNFYESNSDEIYSHLRLHIYPDGGVARFRVYGHVYKDWDQVSDKEEIDLASAINGGTAIACNDMFFSEMGNLIMPGRGVHMGDGWETKRNRTPDNRDWVIIKLSITGIVERIIADTAHFKGNYPDRFSIEGCSTVHDEEVIHDNVEWQTILPQQKLSADRVHDYSLSVNKTTCSHIRLNIFPDGGISRLRVMGRKKS